MLAATVLAGGAIFGCTPPTDPMSAEPEMSVGVPVGRSDDPGVLTDAPIEPPLLEGIDATDAKTVAMRFKQPADGLTLPDELVLPAETVLSEMTLPGEMTLPAFPTPVDSAPSDSEPSDSLPKQAGEELLLVQAPFTPSDQPETKLVPVEVVPTPNPDPITKPVAPPVESLAMQTPELIATPVGEPDPKVDVPELDTPKLDMTKRDASEVDAPKPDLTTTPAAPMVAAVAKLDGKAEKEVAPKKEADGIGFPDGQDGPEDYQTWDTPMVTLVFTGQQHGYIEPCGCTGLDRQKGGVARRFTFLDSIREKGWPVVPMDAGNQVRRFGRQAVIKLQHTAKALDQMDYRAVGFGPDDIRLGVGDLLAIAAEREMFVSANVVLFDPEYLPKIKIVEENGLKIGVTSILDPASMEVPPDEALTVGATIEAATEAATELASKSPDFSVLLFFGKEEAAKELVRTVSGYDLVVVAGGYGEPTYQAEPIDGSATRIIVTGDKGMYAGLVALYPADSPSAKSRTAVRLTSGAAMKYARVPLTHEFEDAPEMRGVMKDYQNQLRDIGLGGLGLLPPIKHSSGGSFVGSATCGKCHTTAYEIWESSAHAEATEHLVHPPKERGDISRHFDPECISCHVTGWNAQEYYPYESGYLALEQSSHLTGNGCENCHGPGADHSAAEAEGAVVSAALKAELRNAMKLPLENAREKCMSCHDLDNSPDFHEPDAFEDVYWPEVEHYGLD